MRRFWFHLETILSLSGILTTRWVSGNLTPRAVWTDTRLTNVDASSNGVKVLRREVLTAVTMQNTDLVECDIV